MLNTDLLKNEELAVFKLRNLYSSFGYSQFKMSKFEEYDLYVKNKDFLISDRIITFTDTNGKLLALKPDVTLSIINNYKSNNPGVQKMYYNENVYRVSGAGGRFREIMQTGLECIGKTGIYEITEVLYLAIKSLQLIDEDFRIELSHAALLSSLIGEAQFASDVKNDVLEALRIKSSGLCEGLLRDGKITSEQLELINMLNTNFRNTDEFINAVMPFAKSDDSKKYLDEFKEIIQGVSSEETTDRLTVNFSLASDAGYYSGLVFKGYINGIPVSVLSGGQYDKLMKKFGENAGAVGFAVYLDSFERFKSVNNEYDVDTVIIIKDTDDKKKVFEAAEKLIAKGEKVYVHTEEPDSLRYRRIWKWEG